LTRAASAAPLGERGKSDKQRFFCLIDNYFFFFSAAANIGESINQNLSALGLQNKPKNAGKAFKGKVV